MKLTIEAETIEELMAKVCEIANHFGVDLSESTKTPVTEEVVKVAETIEVQEEEEEEAPKTKRGRKAKAEEAVIIESKTTDFVTYTKEDLTASLQKVSETKGYNVAVELLKMFGYGKIRDVKEEDFGKLIEACEGSLA